MTAQRCPEVSNGMQCIREAGHEGLHQTGWSSQGTTPAAMPAGQPMPVAKKGPGLGRVIGIIVVVVIVGAGIQALASGRTGGTLSLPAAVNPGPPAVSVTIHGSGMQNTTPFDLGAGDFTVTMAGSGDGNEIVHLVPRGSDFGDSLFNEIAKGPYRYETTIYGVDGGSYFIEAIADGAWTISFTPLP